MEEQRISLFPFINYEDGCPNCTRKNPTFVLNSAIITVILGVLIFTTAFAWNMYVKEVFTRMIESSDELRAMFLYAFILTVIAILVAFFLMYNLSGTKW